MVFVSDLIKKHDIHWEDQAFTCIIIYFFLQLQETMQS